MCGLIDPYILYIAIGVIVPMLLNVFSKNCVYIFVKKIALN